MGDREKGGVSLCSAYCMGCHYRKAFNGGEYQINYCDYLCMTGKRRPCPAGDNCSVWAEKSSRRGLARTPEEREALTRMHDERRKRLKREWSRENRRTMSPEEAERRNAARREHYRKNKERINEQRRLWAEVNKEKLQAQARERYRRRKEATSWQG